MFAEITTAASGIDVITRSYHKIEGGLPVRREHLFRDSGLIAVTGTPIADERKSNPLPYWLDTKNRYRCDDSPSGDRRDRHQGLSPCDLTAHFLSLPQVINIYQGSELYLLPRVAASDPESCSFIPATS